MRIILGGHWDEALILCYNCQVDNLIEGGLRDVSSVSESSGRAYQQLCD
jgi:hypothetical protein